jgi:8-oxoguanine deaminase
MAADIVTVPLDGVGVAGALHDPVAALAFCHVPRVAHTIVNGRVVVRGGQLATLDLPVLLERHNRLARELAQAAR